MKRTKFVLLALVAAMILMGAGYAAWSQTFTINSTVSTGELFVQVSDADDGTDGIITSVKIDTDGDGTYDEEVTSGDAEEYYLGGYPTATLGDEFTSSDGEETSYATLTYDIPEIYPGTEVTSQIKFTNLGTIKIKTVGEGIAVNNNSLWDELIIKVNDEEIDGSGQTKLDNLAEALAAAVGDEGDLEPDDPATVTIVQELPISSENDTEKKDLTWSVRLTFEQYNDQQ